MLTEPSLNNEGGEKVLKFDFGCRCVGLHPLASNICPGRELLLKFCVHPLPRASMPGQLVLIGCEDEAANQTAQLTLLSFANQSKKDVERFAGNCCPLD